MVNIMLLNRLGNKRKIAERIITFFPMHKVYVELFFGSGSIFFAKPIAEYSILNDINSEVFNLFKIVKDDPHALYDALQYVPYGNDVLKYFVTSKEKEPIWQAIKFLYRSNFVFMGRGNTLKSAPNNHKAILTENLLNTMKFLARSPHVWLNCSYEKVFERASLKEQAIEDIFIYADPPYINTINNYSDDFKVIKWGEQELEKLVLHLLSQKCKFAISEFRNEVTIRIGAKYNLNIEPINERQSLKTRVEEILLTNYKIPSLF